MAGRKASERLQEFHHINSIPNAISSNLQIPALSPVGRQKAAKQLADLFAEEMIFWKPIIIQSNSFVCKKEDGTLLIYVDTKVSANVPQRTRIPGQEVPRPTTSATIFSKLGFWSCPSSGHTPMMHTRQFAEPDIGLYEWSVLSSGLTKCT
jgi:hypothetical protein